MKTLFIAALGAAALISSCNDDDQNPTNMPDDDKTNPPMVNGLNYVKSSTNFNITYTALVAALNSNDNIKVVKEINHQQNAQNNDLTLNPTRLVIFGNPKLGTPLMLKNQLAGLDLPQKMLIYQNNLNEVFLAYNNTTYLGSRHGLADAETLPTIATALKTFSENISGVEIKEAATTIAKDEGIITKTSEKNFEDTYKALKDAIESNENLTIIAEVNHQENAQKVDAELRPTQLIVFGNPKLGTPLMQNSQTTAIDLPQKMLVWEDADGNVKVSYNDPAYLKKRHSLTGVDTQIETITGALNMLSDKAIAAAAPVLK